MSGAVVVTPSTGAAWATAWEQFEGIRKGLISLSLTNYDATTVPQIASGSWVECAGSIYKWTSNDTITGTPSSNAINYITMVPSGTGASAILTPTWASGAPTWSDAYQGYFSGTTRYAGGCYYDGTNYKLKWVYTNRHAGPKTRYINVPHSGSVDNWPTNVDIRGYVTYFDTGTTYYEYLSVWPKDFSIIEQLDVDSTTAGAATYSFAVELRVGGADGTTDNLMGTVTVTNAATSGSDTTISYPVIDNQNYVYFIKIAGNADAIGDATVHGIVIKYTEIVRC